MDLVTILQKMHALLTDLSMILQSEQDILIKHNDLDGLVGIIERKNSALIELKILDDQRLLAEQSSDSKAPYLQDDKLKTYWQIISQLTQKLALENKNNGLILEKKLTLSQQRLTLLTSLQSSDVYDGIGQQSTHKPSVKRTAV